MKPTEIQNILKYCIYSGLALLLMTPFIVSDSLYFPFITGKAYFFRVIVEMIFFIWLILATISPQYRPKKGLILYTTGAFMIAILISNLQGVNWTASFWSNFERMEGYVTLLHLFGLFLVAGSVFQKKNHWLWFFNGLFASSVVMILLSFGEIIDSGLNARIETTLGNSTYLAIYMLFNAFVSLFLISQINFTSIEKWWTDIRVWLYSVVFLLQSFVVFQTGTRGAMLGLIGGISLVVLLNLISAKNKNTKKITATSLMVIVVLSGLLFGFKDSDFVQKFSGLKRITNISITEKTAQARLYNWGTAIDSFKERPLFGWGQSNYNIPFDKYYNPAMHGNEAWFDRTHNIIFDWLIAGGILGLILYLSIIISTLYLVWFKSGEENTFSKSVVVSMIVAYFIHNFFVFDNLISYLLFFFILSYAHSQNSENIVVRGIDISTTEINKKLKFILVTLFIFALPVTVYGFNWNSYKANKEFVSATQITQEMIREDGSTVVVYKYPNGIEGNIDFFMRALDRQTFANPEIRQKMLLMTNTVLRIRDDNANEIKQLYVQLVIDQLKIQIEKTPLDSRYTYLLGTFLGNLGQYEQAEHYLLKTIELAPKKQATTIPLIRFYMISGQIDEAVNLARKTYELDTSKDDVWVEYVTALALQDNVAADALVDEAISLGNFARVEGWLKKKIEYKPENPQAYASLIAFYKQIGYKDKALLLIDQTIKKFPTHESQLLPIKDQILSE